MVYELKLRKRGVVMFGSQVYKPLEFKPERGYTHNWSVWCNPGALKVLEMDEHTNIQLLKESKSYPFTILFANGSFGKIYPADPLWQKMKKVAKDYKVQVMKLSITGEKIDWDGSEGSVDKFDMILIWEKESV